MYTKYFEEITKIFNRSKDKKICDTCYQTEDNKKCIECDNANKDSANYGMLSKVHPHIEHISHVNCVKLRIQKEEMLQKEFEEVINECYSTLEYLIIMKTPKIKNLNILEKCSNLKMVWIWLNNTLTTLWDFSKTNKLEALGLCGLIKLENYQILSQCTTLKYLLIDDYFEGTYPCIDNLTFLNNLPNLIELVLFKEVEDNNLLPIINCQNLKRVFINPNDFDMESYAMLESRREDIILNYKAGVYDDCVAVGKQNNKLLFNMSENEIKDFIMNYNRFIKEFKKKDFIPKVKVDSYLLFKENFIKNMADFGIKNINEIIDIFHEYGKKITIATNLNQAISVVKKIVQDLNEFNDKTGLIETKEREFFHHLITILFKEKWFNQLEALLEKERNW